MKPETIEQVFDQIQIDADNHVIFNRELYLAEIRRLIKPELIAELTAKEIADDVQQTVEECSNAYRRIIELRILNAINRERQTTLHWQSLALDYFERAEINLKNDNFRTSLTVAERERKDAHILKLETELVRIDEALDAIDIKNGDAPHRAVERVYRIQVVSGHAGDAGKEPAF